MGSHMVPTSAIPSVSQVVAPHRSCEAQRRGVSPGAGTGITVPHPYPIPGIPRGPDPRLLEEERQPKGMGSPPGCGGRKPHPDPAQAATMCLHLTLAPGMLFVCSILPCLQQQLFPPEWLLRPGWRWFWHGRVSLAPFFSASSRTGRGWVEGTTPGLGLTAGPFLNFLLGTRSPWTRSRGSQG